MASSDDDPDFIPDSEAFQWNNDMAKTLLDAIERLKGPTRVKGDGRKTLLANARKNIQKRFKGMDFGGLTDELMTNKVLRMAGKSNTQDGKSGDPRIWIEGTKILDPVKLQANFGLKYMVPTSQMASGTKRAREDEASKGGQSSSNSKVQKTHQEAKSTPKCPEAPKSTKKDIHSRTKQKGVAATPDASNDKQDHRSRSSRSRSISKPATESKGVQVNRAGLHDELAADLLRFQDLNKWTQGEHVDIGEMTKRLDRLYERTQDAVETLFADRRVDARLPAIVDFDASGETLRQLLERLAGAQDEKASQKFVWLNRMQSQQRLTLDTFFRALIMAAVVEWVLEKPFLNEQERGFASVMVEQLHKIGAIAAGVIGDRILNAHIDLNVKPRIEKSPKGLANKLDSLLVCLQPSTAVMHQQIISRAVPRQPEGKSTLKGTSSRTTTLTYDAATAEPLWVTRWMSKLTDIFRQAQELRVLMDKSGGHYRFDFLGIGGLVTSDRLTANTENDNDATRKSRIHVTLLPALKARLPVRRGEGKIRDEQDISHATIVEFAPPTQNEASTPFT